MSRKHNCKHFRTGKGGYHRRLEKRGLHRTPEMASLDALRSKHAARVKETGSPYPAGMGKLPSDREFVIMGGGIPLCRWKTSAPPPEDDEKGEEWIAASNAA